jgi:hypothetical protein
MMGKNFFVIRMLMVLLMSYGMASFFEIPRLPFWVMTTIPTTGIGILLMTAVSYFRDKTSTEDMLKFFLSSAFLNMGIGAVATLIWLTTNVFSEEQLFATVKILTSGANALLIALHSPTRLRYNWGLTNYGEHQKMEQPTETHITPPKPAGFSFGTIDETFKM